MVIVNAFVFEERTQTFYQNLVIRNEIVFVEKHVHLIKILWF